MEIDLKQHRILLDTTKQTPNKTISVNTNDLNTVKLLFTIQNDGNRLDITNLIPRIAIEKPDKKKVFQECTVRGGNTKIMSVFTISVA